MFKDKENGGRERDQKEIFLNDGQQYNVADRHKLKDCGLDSRNHPVCPRELVQTPEHETLGGDFFKGIIKKKHTKKHYKTVST